MSILTAIAAELRADPAAREQFRELLAAPEAHRALLTPADAAERIGVHPKTLTRAAAAGRVTGATRVGRHWRFDPVSLSLQPPAGIPRMVAAPSARRSSSTVADVIRGL